MCRCGRLFYELDASELPVAARSFICDCASCMHIPPLDCAEPPDVTALPEATARRRAEVPGASLPCSYLARGSNPPPSSPGAVGLAPAPPNQPGVPQVAATGQSA